jgi:hypothetical protein
MLLVSIEGRTVKMRSGRGGQNPGKYRVFLHFDRGQNKVKMEGDRRLPGERVRARSAFKAIFKGFGRTRKLLKQLKTIFGAHPPG